MNGYEDIINLPHHTSKVHPRMSAEVRAAQFSSFAALTGYEGMVTEAARLTDGRLELSEEEACELNDKMHFLADNIAFCPQIELVYFVPDERKTGGKYVEFSTKIRKFDPLLRTLVDTENNVLNMDYIYKIKDIKIERIGSGE